MNGDPIQQFIDRIGNAIVNPLLLLLFSVAFLVFLWGAFEFVLRSDDTTIKESGKRHLLYGIIGMAVMVGAAGIVQVLQATVQNW